MKKDLKEILTEEIWCGRCGQIIITSDDVVKTKWHTLSKDYGEEGIEDLCGECYEEFNDWMRGEG